ncbi:hypothetical protein Hanom_Chr04g00364041 [Helianthus anomalus]
MHLAEDTHSIKNRTSTRIESRLTMILQLTTRLRNTSAVICLGPHTTSKNKIKLSQEIRQVQHPYSTFISQLQSSYHATTTILRLVINTLCKHLIKRL